MSNIRKRYAKISVIIKLFWLLNITPVCRGVILAKLLQEIVAASHTLLNKHSEKMRSLCEYFTFVMIFHRVNSVAYTEAMLNLNPKR